MKQQETQYCMFPIKEHKIFEMYQEQVANFWTATEINMDSDQYDFNHKLNDDERYFIKNVLAFFAGSDEIVNLNLSENLIPKLNVKEATHFYRFQMAMEDIHSHSYALQIESLVPDTEERDKLFRAIETMPAIKDKSQWALNFKDSDDLPRQMLAFILFEGLFFSGSFCALFWLKSRNLLPGLCEYNSLISRDEFLHYQFGVYMYNNYLENKIEKDEVRRLVVDACENEKRFVTESLPVKLIGMNQDLMRQYIEYVADTILVDLGLAKHYGSKQPFSFMNAIAYESKANFFERKVTEYKKAKVEEINLTDDF